MVMPIEMPPDEAFRFIFGVSRQELQDQGVDIQRYVKKHLHKAMRRKEVLDTIVPLPLKYGALWQRWALRMYYCGFVAIGFLMVSKFSGFWLFGIVCSCIMGMLMTITFSISMYYRWLRRRAKRAESGI